MAGLTSFARTMSVHASPAQKCQRLSCSILICFVPPCLPPNLPLNKFRKLKFEPGSTEFFESWSWMERNSDRNWKSEFTRDQFSFWLLLSGLTDSRLMTWINIAMTVCDTPGSKPFLFQELARSLVQSIGSLTGSIQNLARSLELRCSGRPTGSLNQIQRLSFKCLPAHLCF